MNFNRPIIQYDFEGQELKRFANTKRAARNVGVSEKLIIKHLKGDADSVLGKWLFRFDTPVVESGARTEMPPKPGLPGGAYAPGMESDRWLTPFERILKRR